MIDFFLPEPSEYLREHGSELAARLDSDNAKLRLVDTKAQNLYEKYGPWTSSELVRRWADENPGVQVVLTAGWVTDGHAGITRAFNERARDEALYRKDSTLSLAVTWRFAAIANTNLGVSPHKEDDRLLRKMYTLIYATQPIDLSDEAVVAAQAEGIVNEASCSDESLE